MREIAHDHRLTISDVLRIIDAAAAEAFSGEQLRREWLLESRRLRELGQKYFSRAMSNDDINSAAIFIKASERLATLVGLNAPVGHSVSIIHASAPPVQQTSTQQLRAVLDKLCGQSTRESDQPDDKLH